MVHAIPVLLCLSALAAASPPHTERPPASARHQDLHAWWFWWSVNQDRFLHAQGSVRVATPELHPTADEITNRILPALDQTLTGTTDRDLLTASMIAMAKVASFAPESFDLLGRFRARLADEDQEVREVAALSMGVTHSTAALPDLIALALDSDHGRELSGDREVDPRTRTFALYALALIGAAIDDPKIDRAILSAASRALEADDSSDVRVAAVHAVGLLAPDPANPTGADLFGRCLDALDRFWARELPKKEQVAQAHVPQLLAKLCTAVDLTPHPALQARLQVSLRGWLAMATGKDDARKFEHPAVLQSAVAALGIGTRPDDGEFVRSVTRGLREVISDSKGPQARGLALMALAEIGGEEQRSILLGALRTEPRKFEREWAALALGVLGFEARRLTGPDPEIGRALLEALRTSVPRDDLDQQDAITIALGLAGHLEAAETLRELLEERQDRDAFADKVCIGLALMGDRDAIEPIRELVAASARDSERMMQGAIALRMLGDREIVPLLVRRLEQSPGRLVTDLASMYPLGWFGDRRAIEPLLAALADAERRELSRALAAVALGNLADPSPIPRKAAFADHSAYRAQVGTLRNMVNGVLDFL